MHIKLRLRIAHPEHVPVDGQDADLVEVHRREVRRDAEVPALPGGRVGRRPEEAHPPPPVAGGGGHWVGVIG